MLTQHPIPTHSHKHTHTQFSLVLLDRIFLALDSGLCDLYDSSFELIGSSIHLKSLPRIRSLFPLVGSATAYFSSVYFLLFSQIGIACSILNWNLSNPLVKWSALILT